MPAIWPARMASSNARRTPSPASRLGGGGAAFGDEEPAAALRIDQPFAFQLVVGALHRVRVDVDLDGHRPQRGERLAGPIDAGRHRRANRVGDLQVNRHVAAGSIFMAVVTVHRPRGTEVVVAKTESIARSLLRQPPPSPYLAMFQVH